MDPAVIKPTNISIASNATAELVYPDYDIVISCSPRPSPNLSEKLKSRYIHFVCSTGKVGSRQLRSQWRKIDRTLDFFSPSDRILITCSTGKDLAVGVALAMICWYCDKDGTLCPGGAPGRRDKVLIRKRLNWIISSMPAAAPSRATLQSVNACVLGESYQYRD